MANMFVTRRNGTYSNDPFALARELFAFDPFTKPAPQRRSQSDFRPRFNVLEREEDCLIEADLPGVKEADLEIKLDGKQLSIAGSRRSEERKESEKYHVYERQTGSFVRTFALPDEVDADAIEAKLDAGVLAVTVPKLPEKKPRVIPVRKQ